ncbi:MAG: vWA domain-containing protein [Geminicoccaceae bacterium]
MGIFRALVKSFFVVIPAISMPLAAATAESSETDNERAILILDGSGSMWGRIDDTPKISIALDVIHGLLNDWSPKVELGVTTYGHREKGNCADIETLIPIGPVDPDGVMTAIEGLNPKGKTPLTEAVRQAANALRHTEERATVILVSDGKETCGVDPCAVAEELEASGIDFTVHVIGFDLDADEKAQLQCMADNTGGEFLSADNAPELHEAMATTVQLVAEPEPKPKRVIKLETAPVGTLMVENVTGDHVYVYETNQTNSDKVAYFTRTTTDAAQLKAGTYLLGTSQQPVTEVEIAPGADVVVDMKEHYGWLTVENVTGDHVYVYEPGQSHSNKVAYFTETTTEAAQLQAGTYKLGTSKQELTTFEIAPGEEVVIDLGG